MDENVNISPLFLSGFSLIVVGSILVALDSNIAAAIAFVLSVLILIWGLVKENKRKTNKDEPLE